MYILILFTAIELLGYLGIVLVIPYGKKALVRVSNVSIPQAGCTIIDNTLQFMCVFVDSEEEHLFSKISVRLP